MLEPEPEPEPEPKLFLLACMAQNHCCPWCLESFHWSVLGFNSMIVLLNMII